MLNEILFFILAATILWASIKMLNAAELMHAAVFLGVVLAGVAGIYLTLGAELLAAIQVLVYVGAVLTLMLFAIMLTQEGDPMAGFEEDRTPLSILGIKAPVGMDVESMREVDDSVNTVADAERGPSTTAAEQTPEGATDQAEPSDEEDQVDEEPRPEDAGAPADTDGGDDEEER